MFYLKAKYLESRELPEKAPFPKSYLASLLVGTQSMTLLANGEAYEVLDSLEAFEDVFLTVSTREVNLGQLGGKGKAYRLFVDGVVDDGVIS